MSANVNVHLYPTAFTHETRLLRITQSLREAGVFSSIHIVAGWRDRSTARHERLDDTREVWRLDAQFGGGSLLARSWSMALWSAKVLRRFAFGKVNCVNAHSLSVLPVAVALKLLHRCSLVYEPHEIETETVGMHGVRRQLARWCEASLIGFADEVCVTSSGHGDWYADAYSIRPPRVIRNYPYRKSESPSEEPLNLRQRCAVDAGDILFVYQGLIARPRGTDLLLEVFSRVPGDRHIVFMGFGPGAASVQEHASRHRNIHYLPAVEPDRVQAVTATASIGIHMMDDSCVNHLHALPNKVLEYLNAGLPAIVSALPEMSGLVLRAEAGWVVPVGSADQLEELIRSIQPADVDTRSRNAKRWARDNVWETESRELIAMYESMGFVDSQRTQRIAGKPVSHA